MMKKKILQALSQRPGKPVGFKDLVKTLRIRGDQDYRTARDTIRALVEEGVLVRDAKGRVAYPGKGHSSPKRTAPPPLVGRFQGSRRGGGAVRTEDGRQELQIPQRFVHTALHGDLVRVVALAGRLRGSRKELPPEGEVVEILERANVNVTGTLERRGRFLVVVPDNTRIARDVYVDREDMGTARPGDKVVVHLGPWTDEHLNPEGTVVEVLGPAGDAHAEVLSVARRFGLPVEFPPEVLREAEAFPNIVTPEDLRGRLDLRATPCVTIDPVDAKDFDDAVSMEPLPHDGYRLGVHIADVSHFVHPGSALDREAYERGTSVYLVNEVIPMLPERLSNVLCSLRPHEERLAYSIIMDVNKHGTVETYTVRKSVICSARRFTYEEAQTVLESGRGEFADMLVPLNRLARILRNRRRKNGGLDLDTPEVRFAFDDRGLPSAVQVKQRVDAHRLIEECMLLANKTVARHLAGAMERPTLYRVHDRPDPDRLAELARFVRHLGFSLPGADGITSKQLQKLLDEVRNSEFENLVQEVVLRSMAKAVYSTKNIGHYGLSFRHYTHFTSPIRRYPDLVIHRLLSAYAGTTDARTLQGWRSSLPEVARQSSARERVAVEAERASVKVMHVEYMKRHVGDVFQAVITGVTTFGLFVEIRDILAEGLIRVRDLADDYYLFDERQYALRGRSRGKMYRLGDAVTVRVLAVNPEEQEIDFALEENA